MDFEELIEALSKGSATAVTTLESNVADLNALKEYLYVQTPVEAALRAEIDNNLKKPRVIFVCGSSGDGKTELFRRIYSSYGTKVRFHLDATHSFDPQKDAIAALDDQFSEFKAGNESLVVGINIGMLPFHVQFANYRFWTLRNCTVTCDAGFQQNTVQASVPLRHSCLI